jgi:hypothetical protein
MDILRENDAYLNASPCQGKLPADITRNHRMDDAIPACMAGNFVLKIMGK